jgi:DNA-binding FadR family transcriptional regulator
MATELFSLVPAAAGEWRPARALGHPGEERELAFHQTLISYIDNRYLEKIYQQFLDGYIGYVILYLKEDNQESAQILSSLMEAIRQGDRAEIAQETQRYFLSLAEIMRQHMKDWESAEASIREN